MSSAAVVIGALRVYTNLPQVMLISVQVLKIFQGHTRSDPTLQYVSNTVIIMKICLYAVSDVLFFSINL